MSDNDAKEQPPAEAAGTPAAEEAANPPSLQEEIDSLRQKLAERESEAQLNYDRFLRERAEVENFKKRVQREQAENLRFAEETLIRDLLPVIDNLERAVESGEGNGRSVVEGVQMVIKALFEVLARHGVKRVEAVGSRFDPGHHQALAQVESAEHEPNHVVEQHHTGYLLHDRLLRPALVTVSTRKSPATVESDPRGD